MTAPLTILDVVDDPNVFGPWFRNRSTWQAWLAFLATLFGLPLTEEQLAIYQQCTGRTTAPTTPFYEAWLICGRRAGKSFILAMTAVFLSCFLDWQPHLVPGEVGRIVIVAADRKQSRVIFNYIVGFLQNVPMLSGMIVRQTQDQIDLANGLTIEIQAASFRTVRGYSLIAALLDEVAFWSSDETGANPDVEIIRSIRPALASIPGSMLLVASSPYSERSALWTAYRKHHGRDGSHVLTWQAPTRTMNPSIPQSVVDEAMESDPASAIAEFGACFRSDVSSLIERDVLVRATDHGITSRPGVGRSVCFMDAASGVGGPDGDRFAAAWGHVEGDMIMIDHTYHRRPPFDASQAFAEVAAICRSRGVTEIVSDRYSIGFVVAECTRHNLRHKPSELDKSRLYLHTLPQFTSNRVRLPDVPEIIAEFCLLERRPGSDGRDKVDARGNRHEDLANVVAGCIWLLSQPMSNAEAWLELYRKEAAAIGLDWSQIEAEYMIDADTDPIRPPASHGDHGWHFHNQADWIQVRVPDHIRSAGETTINGRMCCFIRTGNGVVVDVHRGEVQDLLRRDSWRLANPEIAETFGVLQ